MNAPLVSAIVVNWNGGTMLLDALASLFAQTWRALEVILVDNASADGSVEQAERCFGERLVVIRNSKNEGFARGNNIGFAAAKGDWVFLQQRNDLALGHVLGDMREEDRVEARRAVVLGRVPEFVGRERRQTAPPGRAHAVVVRVDADASAAEVQQVPTDPATDLEREAGCEAPEIPAERRLHIEPSLPPRGLKSNQPICVRFRVGPVGPVHAYWPLATVKFIITPRLRESADAGSRRCGVKPPVDRADRRHA